MHSSQFKAVRHAVMASGLPYRTQAAPGGPYVTGSVIVTWTA
jgi:hypothetical protein